MNLDEAIVVALGSNMTGGYPSSEELLDAALAHFPRVGLPVLCVSRWWRAAAWPDPNGPEYRNGVALVEAGLAPQAVLNALFSVETKFGRVRTLRNEPRTLDLDLIAHGRTVCEAPALSLPHPRAHERLFVMGPLAEIAPDWRHPILDASARDLAASATVGRDARPG